MNISIKTKDFDLTPSLTEYVNKKIGSLSKLIEGRLEDSVIVDVELRKSTGHHHSGDIFRAEATVVLNQKTHRAVSEKDSIYAAIDEVRDELTNELRTSKEKRMSGLRNGGRNLKAKLKGLFTKNN